MTIPFDYGITTPRNVSKHIPVTLTEAIVYFLASVLREQENGLFQVPKITKFISGICKAEKLCRF